VWGVLGYTWAFWAIPMSIVYIIIHTHVYVHMCIYIDTYVYTQLCVYTCYFQGYDSDVLGLFVGGVYVHTYLVCIYTFICMYIYI